MGRLVQTHSTYIEGLILILKKLKVDQNIKTIIPGVISRVKGNSHCLKIKVTRKIRGGYKLIVRKGRSGQELYITTNYKQDELEQLINKCS